MFDGIIHKIRNGLDDVGSFITGQPAHGPATIAPPHPVMPSTPQLGQVRLGAPSSTLPGISQQQVSSTVPKLPTVNTQPPQQTQLPDINNKPVQLFQQAHQQFMQSQPMQRPSGNDPVGNFVAPVANFGKGIVTSAAQPVVEAGKALYEAGPRTIAAAVTNNTVAAANAQHALDNTSNQVINTGKQFLQFIPREAVSVRNSIAEGLGGNGGSQQLSNFQPHGGVETLLLGNQPIPSIQQDVRNAYKTGGAASAAGTATEDVLQAGLAGLGAKAGLEKGFSTIAKVPPKLTPQIAQLAKDQNGFFRLSKAADNRAAQATGIKPENVINENEAGTLRDFADYKTGSYKPDALTANQLHLQARHAAQTAGIDITSGSPVDVTNRIYGYLGQRSNFLNARDSILQGGYINLGSEPVEEPNLTPNAETNVFAENPLNTKPNISPELQSLYDSQPAINTPIKNEDRVVANSTGESPASVANTRAIQSRNADAERAALEHLQGGGTRDEAAQLYRQMTGDSEKMARFKVQRAAREANQALNPNEHGTNPLNGSIELHDVANGDYQKVKMNHAKVTQRIQKASDDFQAFKEKLTPKQRNQFWDYVEGTKKPPRNETIIGALKAWKNLSDTVHEADRAVGGNTAYIKKFALHSWDYTNPKTVMALEQKAVAHEGITPEELAQLSPQEKADLLSTYKYLNPVNEDVNYGGYHAKNRIFATRQEGLQAGMVPKSEDAFEDALHYANGAKMNIGNEALKKSVRNAEKLPGSQPNHTIDLPGGDHITVTKEGYKALKNFDTKDDKEQGIIGKGFDRLMRPLIQAIVINPAIHGENLGFQALVHSGNQKLFPGKEGVLDKIPAGPVGMVRSAGHFIHLVTNAAERDAAYQRYLEDAGHIPSYGKNESTLITKALDASHLPRINKLNSGAMSSLDGMFRVMAHEADLHNGIDAATSIQNIDNFLGDETHVNAVAHYMLMFAHYFKTQGRTLWNMGRHPLANAGATANFITLAAGWYGLNKAYQAFTGNQNAHVRAPGALGLVEEGVKAPGEIRQGNVPGIVTNHLNPLVQAGANQAFGKDLFTGKNLDTASARKSDLVDTLFGPAQTVNSVTAGKKSIPEILENQFGGAYTPHAAGAPAVTRGPLQFLNTPGSKPDTSPTISGKQDPTGYQQEQDYYKSQHLLNNMLAGDKQAQAAAAAFLAKDKNPDGKTILNSQKQSTSDWAALFANPKALAAVQKMYQMQGVHNPEWDLSGDGVINGQQVSRMVVWARYKSLPSGDLQRDAIAQDNPWINTLEQAVQSWFNKQQFSGNVINSPDYVNYPTDISPDTQNKMTLLGQLSKIPAANRTPDQIQQLKALENDGDIQKAFLELDNYTNAVRAKEDLPEIQYAPNVPQPVQDFENKYMAADANTRSTLKAQYPSLYNQMQQAMEQQSLASAEKYGGEGYYGATLPDSYLSDLYSLGNYDISKVANPNGTNTYALNDFTNSGAHPNGLPTAQGSGISSGSGSNAKAKLIRSLRRGADLRDVRIPRHYHVSHPAVHNREVSMKDDAKIVPKGHYTSISVKKGNKIKNIKVAKVKQYKPAA